MREEHRRRMSRPTSNFAIFAAIPSCLIKQFRRRSPAGLTRNRHMQASVRFSDLKERWAALRWQSGQDELHQQCRRDDGYCLRHVPESDDSVQAGCNEDIWVQSN